MSQNDPLLIQKMNVQMKYLTERQALLSQNIANIDTPSYSAQDLKKLNFEEVLGNSASHMTLATTSAKHISPRDNTSAFDSQKLRNTFEKKPAGNNVVLEEEMGKVSDVGAQYQLTSSLLKKYNALYREAIDSHGS